MIKDIFINLVSSGVTWIISCVYHNRRSVRIWCQSIIRWNKPIRISCAYLFQLKYNNKYLLIKGSRIEQYQPLGGVYKYYNSFNGTKEKMELKDEAENRFYELGDLRQITKGKHLRKFIQWFDTNKNREVMVMRELVEELKPISISFDEFINNLEIEYLKTEMEPIKFSQHFKMDEQKIFNIYAVRFSEETLEKIFSYKGDKYCFVEAEDIDKLCFMKGELSRRISETAKYIV